MKSEIERLKRIHGGMKQRCYNPKNTNYENYGGRGIKICDEWLNDTEKFIGWALTHGYKNNLSIDRIDVNGNYEPNNCRWATAVEQVRNRRPQNEWKRKPPKTDIENNSESRFRKPNNPYEREKTDLEILERMPFMIRTGMKAMGIRPITIEGYKQALLYMIDRYWCFEYDYYNFQEFNKKRFKNCEKDMNVLEALESINGLNDNTIIRFHAICSRLSYLSDDVLVKKKSEINFKDLEGLERFRVKDIQVNQNQVEILLDRQIITIE